MRSALVRFAAILAAVAALGSSPALAQDAEAKAWKAATTCDSVKAYLAAYPQGRFKAEANTKRAKLCGKPGPKGDSPQREPAAAAETASKPSPPPPASAAAPMPQPPSPPPAATRGAAASGQIALPQEYEIVSNVLLPGESYLPKEEMPTGVVLLDRSQRAKNAKVCEAMLGERTRTMRTEQEAKLANPKGDRLVTHWLARSKVNDEKDCDELLAKYNFDQSERIRQTYGLENSKGPLFLALDPTGEIVFLDLADASPDEVFKATSDWMQLALSAPQSGPNAGKPPKGLIAGANMLFARVATGFASLVGQGTPIAVSFNDPVKGSTRQFNVYKAGVYLIGATFNLKS